MYQQMQPTDDPNPIPGSGNSQNALNGAIDAAAGFNAFASTVESIAQELETTFVRVITDIKKQHESALEEIRKVQSAAIAAVRAAGQQSGYGVDSNPNINNKERRSIHRQSPTEY